MAVQPNRKEKLAAGMQRRRGTTEKARRLTARGRLLAARWGSRRYSARVVLVSHTAPIRVRPSAYVSWSINRKQDCAGVKSRDALPPSRH